MKVLIAEDDPISRGLLTATLTKAGYDVVAVDDGTQAWDVLQQSDAPRLAVLDWMMPGMDGVELCDRLRRQRNGEYFYVLLLTTKNQQAEIVVGLEAGADDYITKPYDPQELRLRLNAGARILTLQHALSEKILQLEAALEEVKQLQGILPICMHCKNVRDAENVWHKVEAYISRHSEVRFSHGLCRDCLEKHYPDFRDPEIQDEMVFPREQNGCG